MQSAAAHQEIHRTAPAAVPLSRIGHLVSSDAFNQAIVDLVNASLMPGTRIACGKRQSIVNGPAYAAENGDIWVPTTTGTVALADITSGGVEIDVEWHHDEPMTPPPAEPITLDQARGLLALAAAPELSPHERGESDDLAAIYKKQLALEQDINAELRVELKAVKAQLDRAQQMQSLNKDGLDKLARLYANAMMEHWLNERGTDEGSLRVSIKGWSCEKGVRDDTRKNGKLFVNHAGHDFTIPMPAPLLARAAEHTLANLTATITIKLDPVDVVHNPSGNA